MENRDTEKDLIDFEQELKSLPDAPEELLEADLLSVSIVPDKPMTTTERLICEYYSRGLSSKAISTKMGIPTSTVQRVLNKPHIKNFVKELINEQYNIMKEGRLRLINKIVEDKLAELEKEHDGNLANATKKDIVDLLVIMDSMLKEKEKAELGQSNDTYINIIQQITK